MIAKSVKQLFSSLVRWHLLLGRAPRQAPPCSIILFPAHTGVLCCGIAGILAVKKGPKPLAVDAGANLAQSFSAIRKAPLSRVISGKIKPEERSSPRVTSQALARSRRWSGTSCS
jgi:hypothetical protein